jgi:DNA modification methylase
MSIEILVGDALARLREMPDECVNLICTSPPYWRQRDYGIADQIGMEDTPENYIDKLAAVFRECRRVLRSDGSAWVNIGDKWAAGGHGGGGSFVAERKAWHGMASKKGWRAPAAGYKRKDLIGLPFMLAFALRADGWYWRSIEIWAKTNGMPESTDDRPTVAHEYVLQLAKTERYYYDAKAVKLPPVPESVARLGRAMRANLDQGDFVVSGGGYAPPGQTPHSTAKRRRSDKQRGHSQRHNGFNDRWDQMSVPEQQSRGAALRSVWWLPVANSREEHYAIMPEEMAATIILAGCPQGGVVLDPFLGIGTTALVADRLGRDCIGIDINPDFARMAHHRIERDCPLFAQVDAAAEPVRESAE